MVVLLAISRRKKCMTVSGAMSGGREVHKFCRACLECASRKGGRRTCCLLLQPIRFSRVAMDIFQLPITASGYRYVGVFMDYLTKWPEAFAILDQNTEAVAKQIVCRHSIPEELLSDHGTNFLSSVIQTFVSCSTSRESTHRVIILRQMIPKSCTVSDRY